MIKYYYMINLDEFGMMPIDIQKEIARKEKERRKQKGITQEEMAQRAGLSLSSLRRFEQTGEISFASLVRIGAVLNDEKAFLNLFEPQEYQSMKELLDAKRRKG